MPGPCPVPTAIKRMRSKATGNPPAENAQARMPRCPDYLDDEAKTEWKRMIPMLRRVNGLLMEQDYMSLGIMCQAHSIMMKSLEELKLGLIIKAKSGWVQQSPHVSIVQQQMKIVNGILAEFGMNPSGRVKLQGIGKQTKEASGWDEFE